MSLLMSSKHGQGEYYGADMALKAANGGGIGYFGCWSLIVVYKNDLMTWRNISIFDGYGYNDGNGATITLPVEGFEAINNGNVNVKLGYMAGEGDENLPGDFFHIQERNTPTYRPVVHADNTATNFFNSSIFTGGNNRNPTLQNNTGIDIAMFDLINTNNYTIGNGQTMTNFRFGTDQDVYAISLIAIAIEAFVPEADGLISLTAINGMPVTDPQQDVDPGQTLDYCVDAINPGDEDIVDFKLRVPLPQTGDFVLNSITSTYDAGQIPAPNDPAPIYDNVTKTITWDIGDMPIPMNEEDILAHFCFQLTATTNCDLLVACANAIPITGYSSGEGRISEQEFNDKPFIQSYSIATPGCPGIPVREPISVHIDGVQYVMDHCDATAGMREVTIQADPSGYPVSNIAGSFPVGMRFFSDCPADENSDEYDDMNPFPAIKDTVVYALILGDGECCIPINITVIECDPDLSCMVAQDADFCTGTDGSFTVSVTGGSNDFMYSIDGTNFQTSPTFTAAAGMYTVTVQDESVTDGSCTTTCDINLLPLAPPTVTCPADFGTP